VRLLPPAVVWLKRPLHTPLHFPPSSVGRRV
jgi:hypothetical protein